MTWFKVDDSFHSHSKVRKVAAESPAALGLWTIAGSWSSANLTDGFVPDHQLPWLLPPDPVPLATILVTAGLWRRVRGGYRFHDWEACNPTANEVLRKREVRAAAGRQGGLNSGKARSKRQANASAGASANAKQHGEPPTRPLPSTKEGRGSRPRDAQGAARAPDGNPPAAEHDHQPGCSYANTNRPAASCSICAAIRAGPDEPPTNGGPADPDEARALARAVAARGQPTAPPPPDPPTNPSADPPRAGPPDDTPAWMPSPRRGEPYHRVASPRRTGCGEPTTGGGHLTTAEAADFGTPCPRCWPPPTTNGDP